MIKNILFDFDGVIVDSVNVKTEAFRNLYKAYGTEILNKVVEHHLANGGMSRFGKFKHYHKEFLGIELSEQEVGELADQFSGLVQQGVINAPEVNGSHQFLSDYCDELAMFIITGTPTNESKEICKARGIFNCFKGIYGSPENKGFWNNYLIKKYDLKLNETIFVGDALADYEAAKESSLKFYLRRTDENIGLFNNINNIVHFKDFSEFRKLLIGKI